MGKSPEQSGDLFPELREKEYGTNPFTGEVEEIQTKEEQERLKAARRNRLRELSRTVKRQMAESGHRNNMR